VIVEVLQRGTSFNRESCNEKTSEGHHPDGWSSSWWAAPISPPVAVVERTTVIAASPDRSMPLLP
jgi:hypothetical protein